MELEIRANPSFPRVKLLIGLLAIVPGDCYAQSTVPSTGTLATLRSTPGHVVTSLTPSATTGGSFTSMSTAIATSLPPVVSSTGSTAAPSSLSASFPPVGSVPRDFSPQGLENLWSIVRYFYDWSFHPCSSTLMIQRLVAQFSPRHLQQLPFRPYRYRSPRPLLHFTRLGSHPSLKISCLS